MVTMAMSMSVWQGLSSLVINNYDYDDDGHGNNNDGDYDGGDAMYGKCGWLLLGEPWSSLASLRR